MEMFKISAEIESAAIKILEKSEFEGSVKIPTENGSPQAILSDSTNSLIPFKEIKHDGKTFYIGLPK